MSDIPPQPRPRKRYESNKTLAQVWTGRAILIGILALVGLALYQFGFTVYLLFAKPDRDGPLVWATNEGIGYSKSGGEPSGIFRLPTTAGDKVQKPQFAIVGGSLVYYSPEQHMLCAANGSDTPKWVPLEASMGDCVVRDLRPDGDVAVVLIGYPKGADPSSLPQAVAAARYVIGANDATTVDLSDAIRSKAKTVERKGNSFAGVVGAPTKIVSWHYDPGSDLFAASDGKTVTVIKNGVKKEFGLGVLFFIRHVYAVDNEVWIDAVKPFNSGHLLLTYGPDGAFKKMKVKDRLEMRPPYSKATPEVVDLLTKVSGGVTD